MSAMARSEHPLPLHDHGDLDCMPAGFFGGGRILPALVPACCIDMGLLASFRELMAESGEAVRVQQMRYDRLYAFERLALGHSMADAGLRRLSVILFERYVDAELD